MVIHPLANRTFKEVQSWVALRELTETLIAENHELRTANARLRYELRIARMHLNAERQDTELATAIA